MASNSRPKCFIASGFGYEDVDRIYDRVVRRVLRSLEITPIRVDRVEHNEDIDNQIFLLLDESSLCIADLTHARPSVYYEAGYATGKGKPVVYIVRDDHFRRHSHAEDPNGNLRVHFDLQMKNIISWDGNETEFEKRLTRRLKHVLQKRPPAPPRPVDKASRDAFSKLPIYERCEAMSKLARSTLLKRGFSSVDAKTDYGFYPREFLVKRKGADVVSVLIRSEHSIVQSSLRNLSAPLLDDKPKRHRFHSLILALSPVKMARLERLLPADAILGDFVFRGEPREGFDRQRIDQTIHFITGVTSLEELEPLLKTKADAIAADLTRPIERAI